FDLERTPHGGLDRLLVGNVEDEGPHAFAEGLHRALERFAVDVGRDDARTGLVQHRAGGQTEARGRTGHERHFPLQLHSFLRSDRPAQRPRMVMQATASSMPCRPPPFSASAMRAPSTCRAPASPRSCATSSWIWPRPVAPTGCPLDSSPPDGFTGMRPPIVVSPRSETGPPSPKSQKPRFSIWMISPIAVASCTSATETSAGPTPACS